VASWSPEKAIRQHQLDAKNTCACLAVWHDSTRNRLSRCVYSVHRILSGSLLLKLEPYSNCQTSRWHRHVTEQQLESDPNHSLLDSLATCLLFPQKYCNLNSQHIPQIFLLLSNYRRHMGRHKTRFSDLNDRASSANVLDNLDVEVSNHIT